MSTPWQAIGQSVGNAVGMFNNAAAARKKNNILTQGVRQQDVAGQESAGVMGDFLQQLRSSAPNPAAERGAFTSALGAPSVNAPITGSARFRGDAAGATTAARGYGGTLADLFARIRAPQLQRRQEGQTLVDLGNALRPIQYGAQDDQFLTQLRASMVQPNPWVGAVSGILQTGAPKQSGGGK